MRDAFAVPIQPGQTDACRQLLADCAGPRRAEYENLQRRSGVTEEAYWLQTTPAGDTFIVVSDSDQRAFATLMASPQTDFDRWFRERCQTVLGFDPAAIGEAGPPELLLEWRA